MNLFLWKKNMNDLKRLPVKYIRDRAKSAYKKGSECYVCGTTEELQFHHFYTVDLLWNKWAKCSGIEINSVEDILAHRDNFIAEHQKELYEDTVTLCWNCHNKRLHGIYGQKPPLSTAEKQRRWCDRMRRKLHPNEST